MSTKMSNHPSPDSEVSFHVEEVNLAAWDILEVALDVAISGIGIETHIDGDGPQPQPKNG